ncbi:MAG: hypothetical protein GY711_01565 [bacterium]|nr:hypothetical protein [bacterium]
MAEALEAPFKQVLANAGFDTTEIRAKILEADPWIGCDVESGDVIDLRGTDGLVPIEQVFRPVEVAATFASKLLTGHPLDTDGD